MKIEDPDPIIYCFFSGFCGIPVASRQGFGYVPYSFDTDSDPDPAF
jgi:hypothetical protein